MAGVIVSEPAKRDVRRILSDLDDKAGHVVAARYAVEFEATYRRLAAFPGIGAPRPALGPQARIAVVKPYVVISDWTEDAVTVLRVLHGRRNITRKLVRGG
jgi:toxin ParE1/3/4